MKRGTEFTKSSVCMLSGLSKERRTKRKVAIHQHLNKTALFIKERRFYETQKIDCCTITVSITNGCFYCLFTLLNFKWDFCIYKSRKGYEHV